MHPGALEDLGGGAMSRDLHREIWARYLAGESLTTAERGKLLEALQADEDFRQEALEDVDLHGLLIGLHKTEEEVEIFARSISKYLAHERDATRFVRKFESRVKETRTPDAAVVETSPRRKPRPMPGGPPKPRRPFWLIGLAAAGVFAVVTLLLQLSGSRRQDRNETPARPPDVAASGEDQAKRQADPPAGEPSPSPMARQPAAPAPEPPRHGEEAIKRTTPSPPPGAPDLERKRRIEARMKEELRRSREKTAQDSPKPKRREPPTPETAVTRVSVGSLEEARGLVLLAAGGVRNPVREGDTLLEGDGLEAPGQASRGVLKFSDGTRVTLHAGSLISKVHLDGGKRLHVRRGEISAVVKRQPRKEPLVFVTPHAEASVLGTTLTIRIDAGSTRLEVEEGRVRLRRTGDGKSVLVTGGHYAVAGAGVALKVNGLPRLPRPGLAAWFRGDSADGPDGAALPRWTDRSGNGRDAVQAVPSSRPRLLHRRLRGHAVLKFDGTDDFLSFNLPVNGLEGMTILLVAANDADRTGGPTHGQHAALFWGETELWGWIYVTPFQTNVKYRFGTTQSGNLPAYSRAVPVGNAFTLTTVVKDRTEERLFVQGKQVLRQSDRLPSIKGTVDTVTIGKGAFDTCFPGAVAELIVYARALTDGERRDAEAYLLRKYFSRR